MRSKPLVVVATIVLASSLLIAGSSLPVGAHEFRARTRAKIHSGGPDGAQGSVSSPRRACRRNRVVGLFRVSKGDDTLFGFDRTNRRGMWDIEAPLLAGDYYVKVARRRKKRDGHLHICRLGRSPRVRL